MDTIAPRRHRSARREAAHLAFLLKRVLADADRYMPLEDLLAQVRLRFGEGIQADEARRILQADARLRARLFIRHLDGREHYYLAPVNPYRSSRALPDYPMVRVVPHEAGARQGRALNAIERFVRGL
jgi:hypothetical protein